MLRYSAFLGKNKIQAAQAVQAVIFERFERVKQFEPELEPLIFLWQK